MVYEKFIVRCSEIVIFKWCRHGVFVTKSFLSIRGMALIDKQPVKQVVTTNNASYL